MYAYMLETIYFYVCGLISLSTTTRHTKKTHDDDGVWKEEPIIALLLRVYMVFFCFIFSSV